MGWKMNYHDGNKGYKINCSKCGKQQGANYYGGSFAKCLICDEGGEALFPTLDWNIKIPQCLIGDCPICKEEKQRYRAALEEIIEWCEYAETYGDLIDVSRMMDLAKGALNG